MYKKIEKSILKSSIVFDFEGNTMRKKIFGILVIGLVFSLILPSACSYTTQKEKNANAIGITETAPQLEITIKGGLGINVFIKNIGTTDVTVSEMKLNLDGARIKWNTDTSDLTIKAGKTRQVIYVVVGFGATNMELTLDGITQTASGKVLVWFAYGVQ